MTPNSSPSSSWEKPSEHTCTRPGASQPDSSSTTNTSLSLSLWVSFPLARPQDLPRAKYARVRVQLPPPSSGQSCPGGPSLPQKAPSFLATGTTATSPRRNTQSTPGPAQGQLRPSVPFPSTPSPAHLGGLLNLTWTICPFKGQVLHHPPPKGTRDPVRPQPNSLCLPGPSTTYP